VKHEWSWHRFRYGLVEAAAPEVVRAFKAYKEHSLTLSSHDLIPGVVIFIVFVCFGGVFADAWEEDSAIKCIYNGATFPLVLSAWFSIVTK
jgi:hypothetical protein